MSKNQSYYFICNPAANSGRMKKKWPPVLEKIEEKLEKGNFECIFTEYPKHAMKITENAIENGYNNIIAVGGDGVANEIGNSILKNEFNAIFGMIPMGTSNDVTLTVNIANDPLIGVRTIFDGYTEKLAVGRITGDFDDHTYYFLDHSDCGLAALAAKSARDGWKLLKGETKYTFHAVKQILKLKRNTGTVIVDDEERNGEFTVIAASMGEWMSGYKLWPENHYRMGDFSVLLANGQSKFAMLKLMLAAEKGNHLNKKGVELLRGKRVEINLEKPWPYQAEGEIFTNDSTNILMEYIPDAITMITPKPSEKNQ